MTTRALFCYTIGLWAFSGMRVLIAAFYALQDTRTPVKIAVVSLLLNTFLSLVLMGPLKHAGLALSLSVASGVQFFLLAVLLRKKGLFNGVAVTVKSILKTVLATLVMGLIVLICRNTLFHTTRLDPVSTQIINLFLLVLVGIIIYFFVARLIGCRETGSLLKMCGIQTTRSRGGPL
jgi:putative peptidoglycan lipid II flippase